MFKKLALTVVLSCVFSPAIADEVLVECEYRNVEGGLNTQNISIDGGQAVVSERDTIKMFTVTKTASQYILFKDSEVLQFTITIDRSDLLFSYRVSDPDLSINNKFSGKCLVVDKPKI